MTPDIDMPTRLVLAEREIEEHGKDISALQAQLSKVLWALVGILISTSTATILLALNLVVSRP